MLESLWSIVEPLTYPLLLLSASVLIPSQLVLWLLAVNPGRVSETRRASTTCSEKPSAQKSPSRFFMAIDVGQAANKVNSEMQP